MRSSTSPRWRFALLAPAGLAIVAILPSRGRAHLPSPSHGCVRPASATGDHLLRLKVGGSVRTALVHVPRNAGRRTAPLVLAYHGTGGSGPFMGRYSGLSRVADRAGFIAVYPSADEQQERWTVEQTPRPGAPDDVAFTRALLARVAAAECVDLTRVTAVGVSNGGSFAARLGCELSDRLAAIAVVAGGFGEKPVCPARLGLSVLEIHGTDDPVVPYAGRARGEGAVAGWLADWARRDGCGGAVRRRLVAPRVQRTDWLGCRDGAALTHLRISGGRHQWPGATPPDPGPVSAISAAEEIWRFLASRRITAGR